MHLKVHVMRIRYCNNSPTYGVTGRAGGMLSMIDSQQLLTWDNLTGPGAFSDMDMLEVCSDGLSVAVRTQADVLRFLLWCQDILHVALDRHVRAGVHWRGRHGAVRCQSGLS